MSRVHNALQGTDGRVKCATNHNAGKAGSRSGPAARAGKRRAVPTTTVRHAIDWISRVAALSSQCTLQGVSYMPHFSTLAWKTL